MTEKSIGLKGTSFTLSVLHITNGNLAEVKSYLADKIAISPEFFRGAPLVINLERLSGTIDFHGLIALMREMELVPVGATGIQDEKVKRSAGRAGLAIMRSGTEMRSEPALVVEEPKVAVCKDKIHFGNVRSGQQVSAPEGSLIVIGSVSPGADLIAADSIHVYGTLRGRAVAGAHGNEDSRIYCNKLMAELISVAGHYQISDGLKDSDLEKSVSIFLKDGQLEIQHI